MPKSQATKLSDYYKRASEKLGYNGPGDFQLATANVSILIRMVFTDGIRELEVTPDEWATIAAYFSPGHEWDGVHVWGIALKIVKDGKDKETKE